MTQKRSLFLVIAAICFAPLSLRAEESVYTGNILTPDGKPLEGATVSLLVKNVSKKQVISDAKGVYTFKVDARKDQITIVTTHSDYAPALLLVGSIKDPAEFSISMDKGFLVQFDAAQIKTPPGCVLQIVDAKSKKYITEIPISKEKPASIHLRAGGYALYSAVGQDVIGTLIPVDIKQDKTVELFIFQPPPGKKI